MKFIITIFLLLGITLNAEVSKSLLKQACIEDLSTFIKYDMTYKMKQVYKYDAELCKEDSSMCGYCEEMYKKYQIQFDKPMNEAISKALLSCKGIISDDELFILNRYKKYEGKLISENTKQSIRGNSTYMDIGAEFILDVASYVFRQ